MSSLNRFTAPDTRLPDPTHHRRYFNSATNKPSRHRIQPCDCQSPRLTNTAPKNRSSNTSNACYTIYVSNLRSIARVHEQSFNALREEEKRLQSNGKQTEAEKKRLMDVRVELDGIMDEMIRSCDQAEEWYEAIHS